MAQSITIKIAGTEYSLVANTPEAEQMYRMAADDVNRQLAKYEAKYANLSAVDKFAFVCLQEAVGKLSSMRKQNLLATEVEDVKSELEAYLKGK